MAACPAQPGRAYQAASACGELIPICCRGGYRWCINAIFFKARHQLAVDHAACKKPSMGPPQSRVVLAARLASRV